MSDCTFYEVALIKCCTSVQFMISVVLRKDRIIVRWCSLKVAASASIDHRLND